MPHMEEPYFVMMGQLACSSPIAEEQYEWTSAPGMQHYILAPVDPAFSSCSLQN